MIKFIFVIIITFNHAENVYNKKYLSIHITYIIHVIIFMNILLTYNIV